MSLMIWSTACLITLASVGATAPKSQLSHIFAEDSNLLITSSEGGKVFIDTVDVVGNQITLMAVVAKQEAQIALLKAQVDVLMRTTTSTVTTTTATTSSTSTFSTSTVTTLTTTTTTATTTTATTTTTVTLPPWGVAGKNGLTILSCGKTGSEGPTQDECDEFYKDKDGIPHGTIEVKDGIQVRIADHYVTIRIHVLWSVRSVVCPPPNI